MLCSELVIKRNIRFSCTWNSHHFSFLLFSPSLSLYLSVDVLTSVSFRIRWLCECKAYHKYICNENIYLSIIMWMEFCFFTHFFQFLSLESIRILNYFACFFFHSLKERNAHRRKKCHSFFFRDVVLLIEAIIFIIIALGRNYSSQQIKAHMCIKSNGNLFPFL